MRLGHARHHERREYGRYEQATESSCTRVLHVSSIRPSMSAPRGRARSGERGEERGARAARRADCAAGREPDVRPGRRAERDGAATRGRPRATSSTSSEHERSKTASSAASAATTARTSTICGESNPAGDRWPTEMLRSNVSCVTRKATLASARRTARVDAGTGCRVAGTSSRTIFRRSESRPSAAAASSSAEDDDRRERQPGDGRLVPGEVGVLAARRQQRAVERQMARQRAERDRQQEPEPADEPARRSHGAEDSPRTPPGRHEADRQHERRGQDLPVLPDLEEQPPRSGVGQEDADRHVPGRRRASSHLVPREDARTAARTGAADVRVEVLEAALVEEDRVCERPVPRRQRDGLAVRVGQASCTSATIGSPSAARGRS